MTLRQPEWYRYRAEELRTIAIDYHSKECQDMMNNCASEYEALALWSEYIIKTGYAEILSCPS